MSCVSLGLVSLRGKEMILWGVQDCLKGPENVINGALLAGFRKHRGDFSCRCIIQPIRFLFRGSTSEKFHPADAGFRRRLQPHRSY